MTDTPTLPFVPELQSTPSPSAPVAVRRKPGPKPGWKAAKSHHAARPSPQPRTLPTGSHSSISFEADFTRHAPPSTDPPFTTFLHSPDTLVRARYSSTLDKNEALSELARLRRICEMAAEEINTRLIPDESKCMICGRELAPSQKVCMMANVKDEASGIVTTHPICSLECVRQYNKRRMGLAQVPDQGHVKESSLA